MATTRCREWRWPAGLRVLLAALTLSACGQAHRDDPPTRYLDAVTDHVVRHSNLTYGHGWASLSPQLAAELHHPEYAVPRRQALKLDLYDPVGVGGVRPALVVVHGGGFAFGDNRLSATVDQARTFARSGYVVVAIDYRLLAGKYCYGQTSVGVLPGCYRAAFAARHDAEAAVAWLRTHARRFRIDPDRIAISGESAGGTTAYLVGTDNRARHGVQPDVAAAFSLSGGVPHGRFGGRGDAPALLAVSRGERTFSWSRSDARALDRSGVPSYLDVIAGKEHSPYVAHRRRLVGEMRCFFYRSLRLAGTAEASRGAKAACRRRLSRLASAVRDG